MKICLKSKRALSVNIKSQNKHTFSNWHIFLNGLQSEGVSYDCWCLRFYEMQRSLHWAGAGAGAGPGGYLMFKIHSAGHPAVRGPLL